MNQILNFVPVKNTFVLFTRSYAALRAADLDWIIGPGYSLGGYILEKNHENQPGAMKNHENQPRTMKNHDNVRPHGGEVLDWSPVLFQIVFLCQK